MDCISSSFSYIVHHHAAGFRYVSAVSLDGPKLPVGISHFSTTKLPITNGMLEEEVMSCSRMDIK